MRPLLRSPPLPPLLPVDAHTQHTLLSSPSSLRGVAGCRSLNQARPILQTPFCSLRSTISSPAAPSSQGVLHSSPSPARAPSLRA